MKDCGFCDGSRTIRLAERRRPVMRETDDPAFEPMANVRTFPCPACGDVAPMQRVGFLCAEVDGHERIPEDVMLQQAARALAREVLKNGGIALRRTKEPDFMGRIEYRATMAVVMPRDVATFEARVAERQNEVAAAVVASASAKIANQGAYYGWKTIDKEQAFRLLDEALREARRADA